MPNVHGRSRRQRLRMRRRPDRRRKRRDDSPSGNVTGSDARSRAARGSWPRKLRAPHRRPGGKPAARVQRVRERVGRSARGRSSPGARRLASPPCPPCERPHQGGALQPGRQPPGHRQRRRQRPACSESAATGGSPAHPPPPRIGLRRVVRPVRRAGSSRPGRTVAVPIWSSQHGPVAERLPCTHDGVCHELRSATDGRFVTTASADGTVGIWLRDGTLRPQAARRRSGVERLVQPGQHHGRRRGCDAPDGSRAYVGSSTSARATRCFAPSTPARNRDARLQPGQHAPRDGELRPRRRRSGTSARASALDNSRSPRAGSSTSRSARDGSLIATASQGATVGLWEVDSGNRRPAALLPATTSSSARRFSPDGRHVVAARPRSHGSASYESPARGARRPSSRDTTTRPRCRVQPRRTARVTASADGTARVWDPGASGQLEVVGRHATPSSRRRNSARTDSSILRRRRRRDGLCVWPTQGGPELRSFRHGRPSRAPHRPGRRACRDRLTDDGTARVWRPADGRRARARRFLPGPKRVLFAPNSRGLLIDRELGGGGRVWIDARTPTREIAPLPSGRRITAAAFSPGRDTRWRSARVDGSAGRAAARVPGDLLQAAVEGHDGADRRDRVRTGRRSRFSPPSEDATGRLWTDAYRRPRDRVLERPRRTPLTDAAVQSRRARSCRYGERRQRRSHSGTRSTGEIAPVRCASTSRTVAEASFSADGRWIVTAGPTDRRRCGGRGRGRCCLFLRGPTSTVTDGLLLAARLPRRSPRAPTEPCASYSCRRLWRARARAALARAAAPQPGAGRARRAARRPRPPSPASSANLAKLSRNICASSRARSSYALRVRATSSAGRAATTSTPGIATGTSKPNSSSVRYSTPSSSPESAAESIVARRGDRHPLALAVRAARPPGVDEPDRRSRARRACRPSMCA